MMKFGTINRQKKNTALTTVEITMGISDEVKKTKNLLCLKRE